MGCYFQMGHDTENLVGETDLEAYAGIILSPVNRTPEELKRHIAAFKEKAAFDIVFDPQLYFPSSERGHLQEHPHFPSNFDTANLGDISWWQAICRKLAEYCTSLGVNSVASPCPVPKKWSNEFYADCAEISESLQGELNDAGIKVLTSVVVATKELTDKNRPYEIASVVSGKKSDGYFVVFDSETKPRRELADEDELFGMLSLLRELKYSERSCLVSPCSSDMVLFKYAGADNCSTGKFFNLRRFTKSRYEEPSGGGGQLPYWFEQSLMAFLRRADILRLQREKHGSLLSTGHSDNHWSKRILEQLSTSPEDAWLGLSWRQYLSWFAKAENELSSDRTQAMQWLKHAEENWRMLEDEEILFDEPRNDGSWIRSWRQSLIRFKKSEST